MHYCNHAKMQLKVMYQKLHPCKHRIMEWFGTFKGHVVQFSCCEEGHLLLDWVARVCTSQRRKHSYDKKGVMFAISNSLSWTGPELLGICILLIQEGQINPEQYHKNNIFTELACLPSIQVTNLTLRMSL